MAKTQVRGSQIGVATVQRKDLNVITVNNSVITKIIAGTGVTITSTGGDVGTGDVTLNG